MSTEVGRIHYTLDLDDNKFKRGMDGAKEDAGTLARHFEKAEAGSKALLLGLTAAAGGAVAFGVSSVKAFQESQQALAQLDAVLKSTGGAAGVTKKQVTDLASELQRQTGVSDEAAVSLQSMLLTFTKISSDVFPDVTRTALDMATAMNGGAIPSAQELRQQAIQLGKALQDPDQGLGVLRRVGVNVDELAKKFTDSMSIQEKQRLILQELNSEFGGSAKAAGDTFAGQVNKLKAAFNDLQEQVGEVIVRAIKPLANAFGGWIEQVNKAGGLLPYFTKLIKENEDRLIIIAGAIAGALVPALVAMAAGVWGVVAPLIPFMALGAGLFYLLDRLNISFGDIANAISGVVDWIGELIGFVQRNREWFINIGAVITFLLLPALIKLGMTAVATGAQMVASAVTAAAAWIAQSARMAAATLLAFGPIGVAMAGLAAAAFLVVRNWDTVVSWFRRFKDWISEAVSGVYEAITSPFRRAFNWMKDKLDEVKRDLQKLNPFARFSPSLVDQVRSGTDKITSLYGNMFDNLRSMSDSARTGLQGATSGVVTNGSTVNNQFGDVILQDSSAVDRFFDRIDRDQELEGMGLSPL